MADRATYRSAGLFISGNSAWRVTAFGSTSTLNREDIFEMGNKGVVAVMDESPTIELTLDGNEYGSMRTLNLLFGRAATDTNGIDFAEDAELARSDIWMDVKPDASTTWRQAFSNVVPTSVSYTFGVDGYFQERYQLTADGKYWGLNGANVITTSVTVSSTQSTYAVPFTGVTSVEKVISCWIVTKEGSKVTKVVVVPTSLVTGAGTTKTVKYATTLGQEIYMTAICRGGTPASQSYAATSVPGALSKGFARVYLISGLQKDGITARWDSKARTHTVVPDGATGSNETWLRGIQNATIDVSLDRENLMELGNSKFYERPLTYPINISISLEMTQKDLDMFAMVAGKDPKTAKYLTADDFKNDLGLRVKIFNAKDDTTTMLRGFDIPYMTPESEAWNLSLQGSATQTFSLRSHDLFIKTSFPVPA